MLAKVITLIGLWCVVLTASGENTLDFVGGGTCVSCHQTQASAWLGSHHDLAMQEADAAVVLGDFSGVEFNHYGDITKFMRKGDEYWVTVYSQKTPSQVEEYPVKYTFGVYPLQQYLIPMPDGRLQALTVAWDARPLAQGGQRWFHLYPDEAVPEGDLLHWKGPYQNWNSRCADCHSTHLQKNYQPASDTYATTWQDIDVNCEACHGPGRQHVQQMQGGPFSEAQPIASSQGHLGLAWRLNPVGQWLQQPDSDTAIRVGAPQPLMAQNSSMHPQLNVCGRCHARRSVMAELQPLADFHQQHRLQLLQAPEYHVDGQVRDEDYVLGSFLQSKMNHKGVVCSHCHEPHSLKLRSEGNGVCLQCHKSSVFDQPAHHHHEQDTAGAQCVNCHMPPTTFMVIDPRHDHSFRVPRPDLSVQFGVPNACTQCHKEQSPQWAAEALARWRNSTDKTPAAHFSDALALGLSGQQGGHQALMELAMTTRWPSLVQASALNALSGYPSEASVLAAQAQLHARSPMVRAAAVDVLTLLPISRRWPLLRPLLEDESKLVRMAVARASAELLPSQESFSDDPSALARVKKSWASAQAEYEQVLLYSQDMPEGLLSLGRYSQLQGEPEKAKAFYQRALSMNAQLPGGYLNLSDVWRLQGKESQAESVLRQGIAVLPEVAVLYHAAGLSLIRQQRYEQALPLLAKAVELQGNDQRYGYMYGLLLQRLHQESSAVEVWQQLLQQYPDDLELLQALFAQAQKDEQWLQALHYGQRLLTLMPDNRNLENWVEQMKRQGVPSL